MEDFLSSLRKYTGEFSRILTDISRDLPNIESQIDDNVLEARELLNFIFSTDPDMRNVYGIKHELETFHRRLGQALEKLKTSEESDKRIFSDLKSTIEISNNAVQRIEDIYNISEDLKVFAINSIVYSRKEGPRGRGYQIISSRFIALSEQIAKGTTVVNDIGRKMNSHIGRFNGEIEKYEDFNNRHINSVSSDSRKLMEISGKSVENFSLILRDLLNRIEEIKKPTFSIMVQLQNQDIIQQQMDHLSEVLVNVLKISEENRALLESPPGTGGEEKLIHEYRNINTLLIFLLRTTEKQMVRINTDLLTMIDRMELEFDKINRLVSDVDLDRNMISSLVYDNDPEKSKATVIQLIFEAPKNTIETIISNLESGRKKKKEILGLFREIYDLLLSERDITAEFMPVIESINNLLLLARIEQARNNLDISSDLSGSNIFSVAAFSDLESIITDMEDSGIAIMEKLDTVNAAYEKQKLEYQEMERDLTDSSGIIDNTEQLFSDNFNSVMRITEILSREIREYSHLFSNLRKHHREMEGKIRICSDMLESITTGLTPWGGPLNINECTYKDTTIQNILENLTVEDERATIAGEYSELEIEKTTGSSITLF